jgi:protein-tyrosine phosphatase
MGPAWIGLLPRTLVDIHFHILWGLDDGPPTRSEALALARAAVEAGTRTVVATSHVSWGWPENDAATLARRVADVNDALQEEGVELEVLAGAEVALTRAVELDEAELRALHLGNGPWLLVEPPMLPASAGFDALFAMIRGRGHRIVLAHPERCPAFHEDRSRLEALVEEGMLCSITAQALTGAFGRTVRKFARGMLRDGLVHNVASDAHDASRRTPALLAEMQKAGLSAAEIERLGRESGRAIVDGTPVPSPR